MYTSFLMLYLMYPFAYLENRSTSFLGVYLMTFPTQKKINKRLSVIQKLRLVDQTILFISKTCTPCIVASMAFTMFPLTECQNKATYMYTRIQIPYILAYAKLLLECEMFKLFFSTILHIFCTFFCYGCFLYLADYYLWSINLKSSTLSKNKKPSKCV